MLKRIKGNELCRIRRYQMTREERIEERNCKRVGKRMLHGFILEEADESDNNDSVQLEDDGLGMLMQTFCHWIQLSNRI